MPRPGRLTPRSVTEWGAAITIWVGIGGLLVCLAVWIVTDRVSPALLASFGGLAGIGQGVDTIAGLLRQPPPAPDPDPVDTGGGA